MSIIYLILIVYLQHWNSPLKLILEMGISSGGKTLVSCAGSLGLIPGMGNNPGCPIVEAHSIYTGG